MPFITTPAGFDPTARSVNEERYAPDLPEPLVVAVLDKELEREGRTTAVLVYGFEYQHPESGAVIQVPPRFVTDFASIPAVAQLVIEPFGRHAKAAVLHDWLYAVGETSKKWFADQVFFDAMGELGVDHWRRKVMYQAVHMFGGPGYANAETDWPSSWADWKSGDITPGSAPDRTRSFQAAWARPPRADYRPW